jgi:hypothetical protein
MPEVFPVLLASTLPLLTTTSAADPGVVEANWIKPPLPEVPVALTKPVPFTVTVPVVSRSIRPPLVPLAETAAPELTPKLSDIIRDI